MEITDKLITVVVPVYKVEPYIDKCLTSLLVPEEQLPLLEVLVVNDGTPDRSADMAREYEKRFPTVFRVLDKENGGHGSAWNQGLKEARGKYLRFLDSDDWFTTSEFSRLISRLGSLDADVVISHYNRYFAQTGETVKCPMFSDETDRLYPIEHFDWEKLSWDHLNFWGCTYKTSMLRKEYPLFVEGVYYDDAILFVAPAFLSSSIYFFNATIYNYLIGRSGQTVDPKVKKRNLESWRKTRFQIFDFIFKHMPDIHDPGRTKYIYDYLKELIHYCLVRFSEPAFRHSKALIKEWEPYYNQAVQLFPTLKGSSHTIRCYERLPFPVYYAYRKALSVFFHPN